MNQTQPSVEPEAIKAKSDDKHFKLSALFKQHMGLSADKKYDYWAPLSVTSFSEYEEWEASVNVQDEIWGLIDVWGDLVYNIMDNPEIDDVGAAIATLANEFAERVNEVLTNNQEEVMQRSLTIYKDAYGDWYFAGTYSNNFEDREKDIISAAAHKDFVRALEAGECDYPELWVWHIPNSVGKATNVFYDDVTGMAVVGGAFYKEYYWLAEALSKSSTLGMSHGMPLEDVVYNPKNEFIIDRYRSKEVSVLPLWAAANLLTMFGINKDVYDMADVKAKLMQMPGFTEEVADRFIASMKSNKDIGEAAGLQRKQNDAVDAKNETIEQGSKEVAEVTTVDQSVETDVVLEDAAQTEDGTQVATEPAQDTVKAILNAFDRINKQFDALNQRIDALEQAKHVEEPITRKSISDLINDLPFGEASVVKAQSSNTDISADAIAAAGPQVAPKEDVDSYGSQYL